MGNIVVSGGGELIVGQEYHVSHSRKGEFYMRVTGIRGEWIDGVITDGVAKAILAYNTRSEGDDICVRDTHSIFTPVMQETK